MGARNTVQVLNVASNGWHSPAPRHLLLLQAAPGSCLLINRRSPPAFSSLPCGKPLPQPGWCPDPWLRADLSPRPSCGTAGPLPLLPRVRGSAGAQSSPEDACPHLGAERMFHRPQRWAVPLAPRPGEPASVAPPVGARCPPRSHSVIATPARWLPDEQPEARRGGSPVQRPPSPGRQRRWLIWLSDPKGCILPFYASLLPKVSHP